MVYLYNPTKIQYITKFYPQNVSVLLSNTTKCLYTLTSTQSPPFIRGSLCIDILKTTHKYSKNTLENMKLDELQNVAKMYNLNIKKKGKVGKINITKLELINMILY